MGMKIGYFIKITKISRMFDLVRYSETQFFYNFSWLGESEKSDDSNRGLRCMQTHVGNQA